MRIDILVYSFKISVLKIIATIPLFIAFLLVASYGPDIKWHLNFRNMFFIASIYAFSEISRYLVNNVEYATMTPKKFIRISDFSEKARGNDWNEEKK